MSSGYCNNKFKSYYNNLISSINPINKDQILQLDEIVNIIRKDPDFFDKKFL